MGMGSVILIILLAIVVLVSWVWLLVVAFKESVLWGILVFLFSPVTAIIFAILNWREAKKPFLVYMVTSVIYIAVFFNVFFSMFTEMGVMENMQQVESGEISEEVYNKMYAKWEAKLKTAGGE